MMIGLCCFGALAFSGNLVFGATDDTIRQGERSPWLESLVEPMAGDADPEGALKRSTRDATFGHPEGARTLVLHDSAGEDLAQQEMDGLAAANLATRFGEATLAPVQDYADHADTEYDAIVYIASSHAQEIPEEFRAGVLDGETPVLWAGRNIHQLVDEDRGAAEAFRETYGWNAEETRSRVGDDFTSVIYNGADLDRDERTEQPLAVPADVDAQAVEILARAVCGSEEDSKRCQDDSGAGVPWAVRSGNLTYVAEIPFDFMEEASRYLAFADLYFDLLAPQTPSSERAAVRFEDVGPESDPDDLRRVADAMAERDIPFQVAVFPVHVAKVPGSEPTRWYAVGLDDAPGVVEALRYMQERGGTLVHHGTTHQYGTADNPYTSQSAADYEFYRAYCSATEDPPYVFEDCEQDSWVRLTGPVSRDAVEDHAARIETGREIFREVGLGEPEIFEVPHYAASPNAYEAIGQSYDLRYERVQYFAGLTTGEDHEGNPHFTQFFPYPVRDVYGDTVVPENLGNISLEAQNNHPARPPEFILANAERNLALRESTASFFFHPFLEVEQLEELVDGIAEMGYTFVGAEELSLPPEGSRPGD